MSMRKPKKRDKVKPSISSRFLEEGGMVEFQNPICSSLFEKGLLRILDFPSDSSERDLREDATLNSVKK